MRRLAVAAASCLALAMPAAAQTAAGDAIAYKAPAGDLKPRRVAGNARGAVQSLPSVLVLAPDHLALTVSERPTLLWFLSAPTSAPVEIALVDPRRTAPVLERTVSGERAGIQAFRLDDGAAGLEPGVAYEWSVALVVDPAQRSRDVVTAGAVMRVDPTPGVRDALAGGDADRRAALLAGEGIWYDALAALSDALAQRPGDGRLRGRRAALLEQAGLPEAAAFEQRP